MKTAICTYNDIKAEDVNDLLIGKNEKGELEMTFRTVVHNNPRARRESKRVMRKTVVYGTVLALFAAGFIGFASWVSKEQSESLDRAIVRMEQEREENLALEQYIAQEKQAEKEAYEHSVIYYSFDENGVVTEVEDPNFKSGENNEEAGTIARARAREGRAIETEDKEEYKVPTYVDTSFKAYMDYRTITDTTSKQYEMQQNAWTGMDGVRRIGDDICVAMGTYYAEECGERFEITLDTGKTFNVVVSDIKADKDTDETHRYTLHGDEEVACVIEFIVDVDELGEKSRNCGDVSYSNFEGEITSITKL